MTYSIHLFIFYQSEFLFMYFYNIYLFIQLSKLFLNTLFHLSLNIFICFCIIYFDDSQFHAS